MIEPVRYRRKDIALIMERTRSTPGFARDARPESFLPLSDSAYRILLALAGPPLSDEALSEALEESSYLGVHRPGALRTTLNRLAEQGLVQEQAEPADPDAPPGERPYRVTDLGYAVLLADSGRRRRGRDVA
jgi:DNA-binding PadR family transcriptional regulator